MVYDVLLVILRLKYQVAQTTKSSTREYLDVVLMLPYKGLNFSQNDNPNMFRYIRYSTFGL